MAKFLCPVDVGHAAGRRGRNGGGRHGTTVARLRPTLLSPWRCRTSCSRKKPAAGWPGWTRWDAARSPARCSPPPWCSRTGVPRRARRPARRTRKKLSAEQRLVAFPALRASGRAEIGVAAASVAEIGRLNILHAAHAGDVPGRRPPAAAARPGAGGWQPAARRCPARCAASSAATGVSLSIAAASIIAKVLRDRAMARLALRCPGLWLGRQCRLRHARITATALRRLGASPHHRPGFGTVARELLLADRHRRAIARPLRLTRLRRATSP